MKKSTLIVIVLVILVGVGIFVSIRHHDEGTVPTVETSVSQPANQGTQQPAEGSRVRGPEQKTILIGQSGVVAGITVKVVSLMQDSRCPANVSCIQAGSFGVRTTLTKDKITVSHDFITGTQPFAFEGYNFSISNVTPTPVSGQPTIKLSDYRITFTAAPTAKGANL